MYFSKRITQLSKDGQVEVSEWFTLFIVVVAAVWRLNKFPPALWLPDNSTVEYTTQTLAREELEVKPENTKKKLTVCDWHLKRLNGFFFQLNIFIYSDIVFYY